MVYSALKPQQIRVLELDQSIHHDSVITCSLKTMSLSDSTRPQYEALSYVWGDPAKRNQIILDGQPASITQNLWTALKYIRKSDASRTLWIDAVCINQDDVNERTEQVKQMAQIYSEASTVLIWLGPPNAEIEKTMLALQVPGAVAALKEAAYNELFPKDVSLGLQAILSQPWWHRIWVIQEHVLASTDPLVGCGSTWLEWPLLEEAVRQYTFSIGFGASFQAGPEPSTWVTQAAALIRHILFRRQWNDPEYMSEKNRTISEIVERTRGYQASDSRDQIFATVNLLDEKEKEQFPAIDYTKSVSEVYQEATVAVVRSTKDLGFLVHASDKGDVELGLPSWCVDFSKSNWQHADLHSTRIDHEKTPDYMSVLSHDMSQGTLKVLGGELGQVIDPKPLIPPLVTVTLGGGSGVQIKYDDDFEPLMKTEHGRSILYKQLFQAVLNISAASCKIWADQYGVQEAKERLAAGKVWESMIFHGPLFDNVDAACNFFGIKQVTGPERPYEFWIVEAFARREHKWYASAIEDMGFLHPTPELSDSPQLQQALRLTLTLLLRTSIGKWWFVTDTGYVARIGQEVEAGDKLCTILGCRKPLVLRPCDSGFRLIDAPHSQDFYEDLYRTRQREVEPAIFTLY